MQPDRKLARRMEFSSALLLAAAAVTLTGCGSNYRPVVSSVNPVGPAGQPLKYAVAISAPSPTAPGLVTLVDFAGDTIVNTTAIGANPQYFILNSGGNTGYTLNGDGTFTTFGISTQLLASDIQETTLLTGSKPVSVYPQGGSTYVAESGRNAVAQLGGSPIGIQSELATGAGTIYTVGSAGSPRAYAIAAGNGTTPGTVSAIETTFNTISAVLPVGINPVYGVMTADSARAFILNKGSNSVTALNAQTNSLERFTTANKTVSSTIPVGVGPVWAEFAPTLNELIVVNQGGGTAATPGSVTIISIPRCAPTALASNPVCDPANPLNALGYGTVVANVPTGVNSIMVSVLQDGTRAYVANQGVLPSAGNPGIPGSVTVINLTTNTVTATIPASNSVNPLDLFIHGHPNFLVTTQGTPTGKVYITAADSTDLSILRTDLDTVLTHLSLQGQGVAVRMTLP